jgi:hypothetical protein
MNFTILGQTSPSPSFRVPFLAIFLSTIKFVALEKNPKMGCQMADDEEEGR